MAGMGKKRRRQSGRSAVGLFRAGAVWGGAVWQGLAGLGGWVGGFVFPGVKEFTG